MQIVSTPSAPAAVGPYSQAVRTGDVLFCSGQIALDPATGELVGTTIAEQAERCCRNGMAVMAADGLIDEIRRDGSIDAHTFCRRFYKMVFHR